MDIGKLLVDFALKVDPCLKSPNLSCKPHFQYTNSAVSKLVKCNIRGTLILERLWECSENGRL